MVPINDRKKVSISQEGPRNVRTTFPTVINTILIPPSIRSHPNKIHSNLIRDPITDRTRSSEGLCA